MPQLQTHADLYTQFRDNYPATRLVYRVASDSWDLESHPVTSSELVKLIAFELECSVQKVTNTLAKAAYDDRVAADCRLKGWLKNIEQRPTCDKALRSYLKALEVVGTPPIAHEANVSALKQFIWQVKRGIVGRPVSWHVAPIFWSVENGTGKSFNVRRLIAPLEAYTRNLNVDELSEKFSGRLFARTYVCFLDEFAGAEITDAAQLKAILTGKPFDGRSMYSDSGFYAANRMSCIATSNLPPPHGFVDHTGARRFWSIQCSGVQMTDSDERMRFFDAIDVDAVWASISVNDASPQYDRSDELTRYMDEIRESRLRTKTSLEEFCKECLEESDGNRITLKEFQEAYRTYCNQGKQAPVRGGYAAMSDKLIGLGYAVVNHSRRYYIKDHAFVDFAQTTV